MRQPDARMKGSPLSFLSPAWVGRSTIALGAAVLSFGCSESKESPAPASSSEPLLDATPTIPSLESTPSISPESAEPEFSNEPVLFPRGEISGAPNVLLVSFDTTRADALDCYGASHGASPVIDSLAAQGILFEHAFVPTPVTLPAHTTLFTGLDPNRHGVHDNSIFTVPDEALTLAELLRDAGYRTFASVSAVVLLDRFGLNQGFDSYDQEGLGTSAQITRKERFAPEVATAIIEQLDSEQPWFGFAHFYDPHHPYLPPPDLAHRFGDDPDDRYFAEIASADRQLGRILQALEARDLLSRTWVIVVSDHGEGRGEHGELSHGNHLHDATQRIPLIMTSAAVEPRRVSDRLVTLADVAPTILELCGVAIPPQLDGQSLSPLLVGTTLDRDDVAYLETRVPLLSYDWSPLFGVRTLDWKLVIGSRPHLFDLGKDPGELHDLAATKPDVVQHLSRLLEHCRTGRGPELSSEPRTLSDEERRILGGLGYLSSEATADIGDEDRNDPYDHVAKLESIQRAVGLMHESRFEEAIALFEALAQELPGTFLVRQNLGTCYARVERFEDCLRECLAAAEIRPQSALIHMNVGIAAKETGDRALAIKHLSLALGLSGCPANAYFALADLYADQGNRLNAKAVLDALLSRPDISPADKQRARQRVY